MKTKTERIAEAAKLQAIEAAKSEGYNDNDHIRAFAFGYGIRHLAMICELLTSPVKSERERGKKLVRELAKETGD